MGFKCGIIGLPNVGKSTIFTALSNIQVDRANFPFTTVEPNRAVVPVKDERLYKVAEVASSQEATPAVLEIVDIAGLIEGASRGEGLGNRFLANIREMDLLLHVLRGFEAADVPHLPGNPDPRRDIDIVETELILADIGTMEKRKEKLQREAKSGSSETKKELKLVEEVFNQLNDGRPAREMIFTPEERAFIYNWQLLTDKSVIYVLNIGEESLTKEGQVELGREISSYKIEEPVITISASIELELSGLEEDVKQEFMQEYGMAETGLNRLIKVGYRYLGLITFFTIKGKEARAWAVPRGTTAQKGAGKVHSDMERGFIKAEVIQYEELIEEGTFNRAKEKGMIRIEGKEYELNDGDVVLFHFRA